MKILDLEVKRIKKESELTDILKSFGGEDLKHISELKSAHNFLINNNFLVGYKELIKDTIIVYMAHDEAKDNIYVRKKLRIFEAFLNKHKNKNIGSGVRIEKKKALKFNELLFNRKTDPMKLMDGNVYIIYKNFKEE